MSLSVECLHLFEKLLSSTLIPHASNSSALHPEIVKDQLQRFKLWGGNLKAFHNLSRGPRSQVLIEHRLRAPNTIATRLASLLKTLAESLKDGE